MRPHNETDWVVTGGSLLPNLPKHLVDPEGVVYLTDEFLGYLRGIHGENCACRIVFRKFAEEEYNSHNTQHLIDHRIFELPAEKKRAREEEHKVLQLAEKRKQVAANVKKALEQRHEEEAKSSAQRSQESGHGAMATTQEEPTLPPLPEGWKGDSEENPNFRALGTLSAPVMRKVEPVGPSFLAWARRKRHGRTFSEDERIQAQAKVKKIEDDDDDEISEPEDPVMLSREAKDWKAGD